MQPQECRVQLQGVAARFDGFGLALGTDDGGLRFHLRLHLREACLHRLLFRHHFGFDGALQLWREVNALDHDVLDVEDGADLLPRGGDGFLFDLLATFYDLLGRLERGDFLERLLHPRSDQAVERVARELPVNLHDGLLGHAVEHPQLQQHLLEVGGEAICPHGLGLLADVDGHDGRDERGFEAEAFRQEAFRRFAERDLDPPRAGLDDVGAGGARHHKHKHQHANADELGHGRWIHGATERLGVAVRRARISLLKGHWSLFPGVVPGLAAEKRDCRRRR